MSAATDPQPDQHKWIAFAHLIAKGSIPISDPTLERIARVQQFEGEGRLYMAEKHLRNTLRVLVASLDSPVTNADSRQRVIEFFGTVYKHEKGEAREMAREI
jgi:hypothetical protein